MALYHAWQAAAECLHRELTTFQTLREAQPRCSALQHATIVAETKTQRSHAQTHPACGFAESLDTNWRLRAGDLISRKLQPLRASGMQFFHNCALQYDWC
jgi:hypothetical protein